MMLRCLPNAVGNYNKYNAFGFESIGEEAARWLLDYGTDINMPDRFGYTPMHLGGICPVGIAKSHAYPLEKTDYRR